jgi:hypothetical protein
MSFRWLLASALLLQPGIDVSTPIAWRAADPDERRPGPFLPPSLKGAQAHLQLVGELLLGQQFLGHLSSRWSAERILLGRNCSVTQRRGLAARGDY